MILFEIDKSVEINLHGAVLSFNLAISLRVEGSGKLLFNSEEIA